MSSAEPQQVFVRNHLGKLWGPVTLQTLELLLENKLIEGRIQVSRDGVNFGFPGRFPDIREFVPQELWGDGAPAAPAAAAPPQAARAPVPGPGAVPRAGPGAIPRAGPGAIPTAGPGTRQAPTLRPGPGAVPAPNVVSSSNAGPIGFGEDGTLTGPPPFGEIPNVSPFRLYYLAGSTNQTGRLTFKLDDRAIDVHFRKGNPEHVSSSHEEDALAGFLLRERLATPEQLAKAEVSLDQFGGDLTAALFGTGVLNPGTAFAYLAQRAQSLLMKALLMKAGTFQWRPEDLPPHKAMPLGNRWSVLMDIVRKVPILLVKHRLSDVLDNPVMKSGGEVAIADLRLTPQETRAMSFIDGVRSLNILAHDLPQDSDVFFRLAWVLRDLDIVSFATTKLATPSSAPEIAPAPPPRTITPPPAPPPPAATPTPPPVASATPRPPTIAASTPRPPTVSAAPRPAPSVAPAARPVAPANPAPPAVPVNPEQELKALRELAEKVKQQNHFEVLGLKDNADSGQVKLAYFKLAKLYHPDTIPQNAPPEVARLKADIFGAVGEAYRTIGDDASRARYLEELRSGGGGDVDVLAILRAEELFQKGCILVKAKKFPDAVEMLSDAITTNGDEGEFYAWRGIARFFANPDRKVGQQEADRDLQQALKKNPRCAQAFYFQGQMSKLLGDQKKALEHFKKTLDLQPDHLDAQREIRYLKK